MDANILWIIAVVLVIAGNLTRDDVDADMLTALMAGGEELSTLTATLTALHPELGER